MSGIWAAIGVILLVNALYLGAGMWWRRRQLRAEVFAELDRAAGQGWIVETSAALLAEHLVAWHGFDGYEPHVLTPYVRRWLRERT